MILQFHNNLRTGYYWRTKTHVIVALVGDVNLMLAAFFLTPPHAMDKELTERLREDLQLKDFLVGERQKLKEAASTNPSRSDDSIS